MRLPIRIMSIGITIFWLSLIAFSASAIYSMKDFQFSLGEPEIRESSENELLLSFPAHILNTGYYSLTWFNLSTSICRENQTMTYGSTRIPLIKQSEAVDFLHTLRLNLTNLLESHPDLLVNDGELKINNRADMTVAGAIPIHASSNFSMPWGAPLYDLVFGVPQLLTYNATHILITVPTSFDNHAFFNVTGTVHLNAYGNANAFLGHSKTDIAVAQHSQFRDGLEFYVSSNSRVIQRFEVLFSMQFFGYGPLVILNDS